MASGPDDMTEATFSTVPTAEDIKDALSRTGFLLEYRVAQSLRQRRDCEVSIGEAYPDPETGKSREFDVHADIHRYIRRDPVVAQHSEGVFVTADLIIECKNSSGPFVLIGDRNDNDSIGRDDSLSLSFDPLALNFPKAKYERVERKLNLGRLPGSPKKDEFLGYQLLRINRQGKTWKADNASIYDSILYPLAKAVRYLIDRLALDREQDELEDWEDLSLGYFFPIIVTSGQVFAVDVTSGEPEVSEVKWAGVRRRFMSQDLKDDLRADVVSFAHLEEYLDTRIMNIVDNAESAVARNMHLFDPEWLLANLGEPESKDRFNDWLNYVREARSRNDSG